MCGSGVRMVMNNNKNNNNNDETRWSNFEDARLHCVTSATTSENSICYSARTTHRSIQKREAQRFCVLQAVQIRISAQ